MQASATTIYEDGSQGKRSGVPLCEKSVLEAVTFRDHTVPPDANPIRNIERGIKRNVADGMWFGWILVSSLKGC